MKYIVRLSGRQLKPFGPREILGLVESGALSAYDYIYHPSLKDWVRVREVDELKLDLVTFKGSDSDYQKPGFHPPSFLISNLSESDKSDPGSANVEYLKKIDDLKHQLDAVSNELEKVRSEANYQDSISSQLKMDLEIAVREHKEMKEDLKSERERNRHLKDELVIAEEKVKEIVGDKRTHDDIFYTLEKDYKEMCLLHDQTRSDKLLLESEVDLLKKELKISKEYTEQVLSDYKSMVRMNKSLNEEIEKFKKFAFNEKNLNEHLRSNILKLNKGVNVLKRKGERDQVYIKNLEKFKKVHLAHEEDELKRLIGDSYEVKNLPNWLVFIADSEKGPFSFEEILEMLKRKKIGNETPIRKKGEADFYPIRESFEFSSEVIIKKEKKNGKVVNRYFIKRNNYRAPFYDLASIDIAGEDFQGYCTSISLGGCFVELLRVDSIRMKKGNIINLKIRAGTLGEALDVKAEIRNVSNDKPRGLGLSFIDLESRDEKNILSFVDYYVASSQKKVA